MVNENSVYSSPHGNDEDYYWIILVWDHASQISTCKAKIWLGWQVRLSRLYYHHLPCVLLTLGGGTPPLLKILPRWCSACRGQALHFPGPLKGFLPLIPPGSLPNTPSKIHLLSSLLTGSLRIYSAPRHARNLCGTRIKCPCTTPSSYPISGGTSAYPPFQHTQQLLLSHPKLWSEGQIIFRLRPGLALPGHVRWASCV